MFVKSNLFKSIVALLIGVIILSCEENVEPKNDLLDEKKGSVQFSFQSTNPTIQSSARVLSDALDPFSVIVTIHDDMGNVVMNRASILLYNFNGEFISEPLELVEGEYSLEEYFVADESNEVIYATPKSSASAAYLVSEPLPIDLTISVDEVTRTVPEVISVEGIDPTDLGYATFDFEVVETFELWVSGFIYNGETENLELTSFDFVINPLGFSTVSGSVESTTKVILLREDVTEFETSFEKQGFVIISDIQSSYTKEELSAFDRNNPLEILFEKKRIAGELVSSFPSQLITNEAALHFANGEYYVGDEFSPRVGVFGEEFSPLFTITNIGAAKRPNILGISSIDSILFFSHFGNDQVLRQDTDGSITEYFSVENPVGMFADDDQNIWLAYSNNHIRKFNEENDRLLDIEIVDLEGPGHTTRDVEVVNSRIFILHASGTENLLFEINESGDILGSISLGSVRARYITTDQSGSIYVTTNMNNSSMLLAVPFDLSEVETVVTVSRGSRFEGIVYKEGQVVIADDFDVIRVYE